ncbi:nitrite/sulfite reductase [Hydrogenimonas cancrithermarum]|uniref:Ferredoxin--nitrite reductase n=1 Tax=Hydrogenimonas cancrithermarum TaxID=2993563 RepID=A0ABM8FJ48_9BACT|nr:nitrite/sulfite reductase [Hydrogenimonas cancrithermarum]BDY12306.1 hypothetical protein HCR_06180 [Hydrogenimonas cancrithermarum]
MKEQKINKIEKLKRQMKPADFFEKLPFIHAEALDEADRFYLKNFGIYNHKLAPETFTLRIRIPAGRIATAALKGVRDLACTAGGKIIVTSRAQLEVHGLDFPSALRMSHRIESFGLTSWQTYSDNFRNIVTDPLDGLEAANLVEVYDLVLAMQRYFLKNPDYVGMIPRKFNVAISGTKKQRTSFFGNDLYFALARKDGRVGFNLYAGGKNSETARSLDIFAEASQVPVLFRAVAEVYREEGPRASRSKARLFHMIEAVGIDGLRAKIAERLGKTLPSAGELLIEKAPLETRTALKNGTFAHRYTTRFGELSFDQFDEILHLCGTYGVKELRIGCDQNFYIPGLPEKVAFAKSTERYGGIVACAGSKYCVYSLMDTKKESDTLALEKCRRLGISLGFSGCLKGCARHAFSDIGLVGIRTKLFAEEVERGVRLYLGSEYTHGKRAARLILYSVPMRHLNAMIDLIADLFAQSGYRDFEDFSKEILNRYSEPALAFWLLLNHYRRHVLKENDLLLPEGMEHEDEKSYFIGRLLASGTAHDRSIVEYLQCQEAFPFREAIIYLERSCFKI